jgi:MFS family permease
MSFRLYLCSRVATNVAFNILGVAIGWQIYDLTGSAFALGMIGFVQFIPLLALAVVVGHVADRYDRRLIAVTCQVLEGIAVAGIAAAVALHAITPAWLFVATFVVGIGRAFENPTTQALLPNLVSREQLPAATANWASANRVAVISGPALGGLLYAVSPALTYGIAAVTFAAAAILVGCTRPRRETQTRPATTWVGLFAGFTFVVRNRLLLGCMSLDLFSTLFGGATALLPIYARDILDTGPWGLGLLRSAMAVGALGMTLALGRYPIRRRAGTALFAGIAGFGAATVVFAFSRSFVLAFVALAIAGLADVVNVLIRVTLTQLATPDDMRGRVNAVASMFAGSANQLGQFESGLVAAWIGAVPSAALGGIGTVIVALLWMQLFPQLRNIDALADA